MRKLYFIITPVVFVALLIVFLSNRPWGTKEYGENNASENEKEDIRGALEDNIFTSSDVDLGTIPRNKLFNAIQEGQRRLKAADGRNHLDGSLTDAIFRERGPSNVGGRTRAIHVDDRDPNRNRIWLGGVSGGLWRTEDITQDDPQWKKIGIYLESTSISDIAQDPNDFNTLYVGTGESYTGDFQGVGIFKTTDDGETWTLLPSTRNSNFQYTNEVYVFKNSDIYAATSTGGLLRSKDGGQSWEKVLGTSLSGANSNDFHDFVFNETNQTFYTSNDNSVFKSTTGNRGDWVSIGTGKPGFPTNLNRIEMAVCPNDPDVIYVLGAIGGSASNIFSTSDGGDSWLTRSEPGGAGVDFTNGQAWYDLDIAVDPLNCGRLLAGGVGMLESTNFGISWQGIANGQIHVDHHYIRFDAKKPGRVFYGDDGGVWMSNNSGNLILNKNIGYVSTQFYCGAIHPDAGSPYCIGGTQDNNTMAMEEPGLSPARVLWGGDGVFCFIDQNEPDIQIVSSQGGNYGLSTDGGKQFGNGSAVGGAFINRSGYDDNANILYGQTNGGGFFRWRIGGSTDFVTVTGAGTNNFDVSAVKADPFVSNRIYFGVTNGRVIRVDNANTTNTSVPGTVVADLPGTASVSCFYMDKQTPNDMLISLFNYGATLKNVWVSYNAGGEWNSIEGDLPDIPVRWAIFDPANHDRAMIATDAGVWTTDDINGDQTHWDPTNPGNGMPFVRVDMLLLRESDKVVLAATHGRGLMTTDVFSSPAAVILAQPIAYVGQPLLIDGSQSVNAQSYEWNFGDASSSSEESVTHTYTNAGIYNITLTINGSITQTRKISILPYLPAPYEPGVSGYAGDFDSNPEHFAAFASAGTGFQRGSSIKPGKDGTHSGSAAWVLGINDNLYANNTRAEFYTPMYDLSDPGLYELKFWTKYAIQNRNDGFQIEYSLNGGSSWQQLGSKSDPAWYNYLNSNLTDGAFPEGKSYFTNVQLNWTQYVKDISFLGGEAHVSFRFVFRSDAEEQAQGVALDDFEVGKYDGELKTTLTTFTADYTGDQEITVNWTTGLEYQCQKFILERSYNGFGFSEVGQLSATGGITTIAQHYTIVDQSLRNVIFYRLKVINDNPDLGYHDEFYSGTIVVRRNVEPDIVHDVLPNPFTDKIGVSFSSVIDQQISLRLFDTSGRLVREDTVTPHSVYYELDGLRLPPGIYILSVQIGDAEPTAYKLLTAGQ
ncbi:MAG: PKD domain-containing protein [Saprospiraceae bacterium]|uniref:PKD domain-containing protein n=1 Tax=Candidatus Opimibacter skivensis TaxID=2982028 RepID=A0A9D7XRZ0_9BACT|nr:PKD domain-containing protein [Candidatus Opimibacter skivensis]